VNPVWLFVLLAMAHYTYDFFPNRWATCLAFMGLLSAWLLWSIRGPRHGLLWLVCVFGVVEGLELFACQLASNWQEVDAARFRGVCEAYTGVNLYGWGLVALAFLAHRVAKAKNGRT
jgi:hypothetical protein